MNVGLVARMFGETSDRVMGVRGSTEEKAIPGRVIRA